MATSHTWFATDKDISLILDWLVKAGAQSVDKVHNIEDFSTNGSECAIVFPTIGPTVYWPDPINLSEYEENTSYWRQAILTKRDIELHPQCRMIDPQKSPTAGLKLPYLRDGKYWAAGSLWFPTINLKKVFPELARICGRFERWIRKFPTVFDNRKGKNKTEFDHQICHSSIIQCINALPDACSLLKNGACMVDHMTSDFTFRGCKENWKT
ncbi:hypothetical protein [Rubinisphaera italica]|uniref:Uncharacterized protein n=1 Tax=Rubinisphaera italica TaxID=2527969 RepID=A0A5C5XLT8_9PLAN|nr:hypothetical protein [Rubinisphaera italica]TWT63920.1 hypothetical protein Pan54_46790 [Rubinisphaera italica]